MKFDENLENIDEEYERDQRLLRAIKDLPGYPCANCARLLGNDPRLCRKISWCVGYKRWLGETWTRLRTSLCGERKNNTWEINFPTRKGQK